MRQNSFMNSSCSVLARRRRARSQRSRRAEDVHACKKSGAELPNLLPDGLTHAFFSPTKDGRVPRAHFEAEGVHDVEELRRCGGGARVGLWMVSDCWAPPVAWRLRSAAAILRCAGGGLHAQGVRARAQAGARTLVQSAARRLRACSAALLIRAPPIRTKLPFCAGTTPRGPL